MTEPSSALAAAALYAGLHALILAWLGWSVVRIRMREKVLIGDAGNPRLIRAMRGMSNFAEYAPVALLLLFAAGALGTPAWVVHLFGVALTAARLMHGWHFMRDDAPGWQRAGGTMVTMTVLLLGGLGVAAHALVSL